MFHGCFGEIATTVEKWRTTSPWRSVLCCRNCSTITGLIVRPSEGEEFSYPLVDEFEVDEFEVDEFEVDEFEVGEFELGPDEFDATCEGGADQADLIEQGIPRSALVDF